MVIINLFTFYIFTFYISNLIIKKKKTYIINIDYLIN